MNPNEAYNRKNMKQILFCMGAACLAALPGYAQKDSSNTQSIDITSSFKPVLRNAVKINFSGTQLAADTSRPSLGYSIPSQNLFYAYQPVSLRPLALQQDTNLYLGNRNYLKAGFGSYNTPYVAAGFSFGDGKKSLLNINADYIASKGNNIEFQDYNMLNVRGAGSIFSAKNEVYASAKVSLDNYYLYGYDHTLYNFTKRDLRQQFQEIEAGIGIRNTKPNDLDISYNPSAYVSFFTNKDKLSETTLILDAPAEKKFNEQLSFKLRAKGDFTNYATKNFIPNNYDFANNILQLMPGIGYNTDVLKLSAGVTPTWTNGKFTWLPDVYAEIKLQEKAFLLQAGWVGRYVKNTYRNLSGVNPYLDVLTFQQNTKEVELYGGIKATVGKHFNFSAKAGWIQYHDLALFINDTAGIGNVFKLLYEPTASNLRIHGDVSYISQDKFTLTAGLTLNGYTGVRVNRKAWHTLPVEFTSSLRWWAFEKLLIKGDFYFFNGGNYLLKGGGSRGLTGGTDLSAGAEYKINKQFSAWASANNILNDKYERLHNYQVYGLNLQAGVLIRF